MVKNRVSIIVSVLVASLALTAGSFAQSGVRTPAEMIGASVVGPGGYTKLGEVVGIGRSNVDGTALVYVVAVKGLFGGKGVIPLSSVVDEMPVPEKDGTMSHRIEVSVNKATFRNIANWDSDGEALGSYLSRIDSILGTIYGLDEAVVDQLARQVVFDGGVEEVEDSSIAGF